jgi:DNA polymerase-2
MAEREHIGFIVSAWDESGRSGGDSRIRVTGRLEDGRSFALLVPSGPPSLYVNLGQGARALEVLRTQGLADAALDSQAWTDLPGAPLARLIVTRATLGAAERALGSAGVRVLALERPRADQTLAQLGLAGPVRIRGEDQPGRRVDCVFVGPALSPSEIEPRLKWLALDIETDPQGTVTAVSLAGWGGEGEVLFVGEPLPAPFIASFATEAELLAALAQRIAARDPDVITGWNVIDFDLDVLFRRFAEHKVPFLAGRTADPVTRTGARQTVRVPGRAVLDALRLVRGSGERFEDLTLEAVAQSVLGEGKTVHSKGEEKLAELARLRRDEPVNFCAYCLRDSELVLRILAKTGLDALTARRAALTGVPLELAWTSIPAFERIYATGLRARHVLPPEKDDQRQVSGAAGGTVLEAFSGIYPNVLVFDFRSLYPSIIRTFNIDPLSHARSRGALVADEIEAPNGARFERKAGILPEIISRYAAEREEALAKGDDTAAYVYKILQNSFYGVLGAPGCRYALTELAAAITSFGKKFLTAARDFFEALGQRVLYGDTDSVFVLSGLPGGATCAELLAQGDRDAAALNLQLTRSIEAEYRVQSFLKIRCDKAYRRFLIPRMKSDAGAAQGTGRGRAKGYAGLRLLPSGNAELDIKGMEAVRSDFTPLARRFQTELLARAFADAGEETLRKFCRDLGLLLLQGGLDGELIYRKSLRRSAEEYGAETPQVRAARMLGWTSRRGRISYVMTTQGAEPVEARSGAPLDYRHYLEHQLAPIAVSVADALGHDGRRWLEEPAQLELDF